jgi:effector-binding domain-containing protein
VETWLSEVSYTHLPPYRMAMAKVVSTNPEEEVIRYLEAWVAVQGIDIKTCRRFGFDVPLSDEEKEEGRRGYEYWMAVPDTVSGDDNVRIVDFSGGDYITLRITDPFASPFVRISKGWQTLVEHVRQCKLPADWCNVGGCLEEVIVSENITCMDIFIRLK